MDVGKILLEGGCMRSKGTKAGKLGMHLGNSKLGDLINRIEILVIGGFEISMA